jgi:hypothetical protein
MKYTFSLECGWEAIGSMTESMAFIITESIQRAHDVVDDTNQMCRAFVDSVFHNENYMGGILILSCTSDVLKCHGLINRGETAKVSFYTFD